MVTPQEAAAEKSGSKGQAWFCTTGLPSDVAIEVDDMTFHLHKFPLMSKSRKLHDLITEQEANPGSSSARNDQTTTSQTQQEEEENREEHEIEEFQSHIVLADFPGGCETFEMAAKFCYGVKVDLNSSTVAPLRCAGEFLEMTEEYSEENLISKTERFLSESVLKSIKESIKALKSCERVMPLAETLGITQRCIESITRRAPSAHPSLFGWPVSDGGNAGGDFSRQIMWNGAEISGGRRGRAGAETHPWFEEITSLGLPLFRQLILVFRNQDLSSDIIETCLMCYAKRYIPGLSRSSRKSMSSSSSIASESEQRELLEIIIGNLPTEKSSRTATGTRFLFGLLRTANILNASESCRAALEKKIGSQLEEATLDDLLIPSYSYLTETLYDVDCVERILAYFLDAFRERNETEIEAENGGNGTRSPALMLVGKLIDGYLSEIATDSNLKPDKFYNLAISLPEQSRLFNDGLYRAVDVYLKAHPWMSEPEREKICGVIDCQKLTLEACTHAAQNERLPLRAIVQVLFFEQLQLRHAITGTLLAAETAMPEPGRLSAASRLEEAEDARTSVSAAVAQQSSTWRAAVRENQVLRSDMDSMRTRVQQLEEQCSTMRTAIARCEKVGSRGDGGSQRGSLKKRFGCKFKTQVCDSQESTAVEGRKGRHLHRR